MPSPSAVRAAFHRQAESCQRMGSPFTARLCTLAAQRLDSTTAVGRTILAWQGDASYNGDVVPLRLAGALQALVLAETAPDLAAVYPPHHDTAGDDALWAAIVHAMTAQEAFIIDRLAFAPQTNEVRRSGPLVPGFLEIARRTGLPLVLSELGASAGLNQIWDRYGYRFGSIVWGDPTSPVQLAPDWTGPLPHETPCTVHSRAGCDLNPLDIRRDEDRRRLLSYIWADQTDRHARTEAAIELAIEAGVVVERADAIDWLGRRLATRHKGAVHVVYHTVAWQYFPEASQARGAALIAEAGRSATDHAPLAWLRHETDGNTPGVAMTLTLWPSGEEIALGRVDHHGRWVEWALA